MVLFLRHTVAYNENVSRPLCIRAGMCMAPIRIFAGAAGTRGNGEHGVWGPVGRTPSGVQAQKSSEEIFS